MAYRGTYDIRQMRVRIVERADGGAWRLFWTHDAPNEGEWHPSAGEALEAVRTMARILANGGLSTATEIQWEPCTDIGRSVVKVLSESGA